MNILFLDCETTGKLDFKAPLDAPHQPRLVELAMAIYKDGQASWIRGVIVRPDGFEIPQEAIDVHGITNDVARASGLPIAEVLALLREKLGGVELAVAFNWAFDSKILEGEYLRAGTPSPLAIPHACAMLRAKDHCKIPGNYGDFKWPKLSEAYQYFFGGDFDWAHRAGGDVEATARIWFEMERGESGATKNKSTSEQPAIEIEGADAPQELVKYASGLEPVTRQTLVDAFRPVFAKAHEAIAAARGVAESVVDATCVTEIRKSRACRLAIRAVRIEAEKIHRAQKEHALRFGKAVDGFKNILLAEIAPVEEALQAAEDTAERAEAARKAALKAAREAELIPLLDGSPIIADLSSLTAAAWEQLLADHRLLRKAKLDAAEMVRVERLAWEEEARRVAAENARLKQEALDREAAAKAEREESERKLAAERAESARVAREAKAKADAEAKAAAEKAARERAAVEAKAKAEREAVEAAAREEKRKLEAAAETERRKAAEALGEARALRDAEEKRKAQEAAAARKAAAATDKVKVKVLAGKLRDLACIDLDDEALAAAILERVNQLADWCQKQAGEL